MLAQIIEATLVSTLDRLSNREPVEVKDEWIEEAGEQFKAALRKQFTVTDDGFTLRMSNIGRPLCQLQMAKSGVEGTRMTYNHVMRMLIGDAVEAILRVIMKAAKLPVTSDGDEVALNVGGHTITGTSDVDIDNEVYDIKTCSPWAFKNKWQNGWDGLYKNDEFGYVGQLYGYADAQNKEAGGWIVVDKSSGELTVVPAEPTQSQREAITHHINGNVRAIVNDEPFRRCFEAEAETYYGKPTGKTRLPKACSFCSYIKACWPNAEYKAQEASKAANPPYHWYVKDAG